MDVTIPLDEETERWVREEAARGGVSVSAFVARIVREALTDVQDYEAAFQRYRARSARSLSSGPHPTRDELYDR